MFRIDVITILVFISLKTQNIHTFLHLYARGRCRGHWTLYKSTSCQLVRSVATNVQNLGHTRHVATRAYVASPMRIQSNKILDILSDFIIYYKAF